MHIKVSPHQISTEEESKLQTRIAFEEKSVSMMDALQTATASSSNSAHTQTNGVIFAVNDVQIPSKPIFTLSERDVIDYRLKHDELIDEGAYSGAYETSTTSPVLYSRGHKHGFVEAITTAFGKHYPLALRPQHIWLLILQGIAEHVTQHAETLRSCWVKHQEGKKTLAVIRDEFLLHKRNDWLNVIMKLNEEQGQGGKDDSFLHQIRQYSVEGAYEDVMLSFSESTPTEQICMGITIMDTLKEYFDYKVYTRCGFPSIQLEGTLSDWESIRSKAEQLITTRCEPAFATRWLRALLPLLDIFIAQYRAASLRQPVDAQFWSSMCKRGGDRGSGGYNWLNGWFNIFFPYLKNKEWNRYCEPYSATQSYVLEGPQQDSKVVGVDEDELSVGISQVPVIWDYYGREFPLIFYAGFICAKQDCHTKVITPNVAWYVAGDANSYDENA